MTTSRSLADPFVAAPLPRRHVTEGPGIGGVIKARAEDFVVEELPLYEPCGRGEHLYLRIEKSGVSHGEMMSRIRRRFGVREKDIGFAGMKDKVAVSRQTVSIYLPGPAEASAPDLEHERIRVIWASRHTNKIRLGHLAGNRFSIRIREVDPSSVIAASRSMRRLVSAGLPNYFGLQRFGYRCNNHVLGLLLLGEDWRGVLAELLGAGGSPFPDYQRERRELFDRGRYAEAAALWTPADRNELVAIKALAAGRDERGAVRAVGRTALAFWISALQSAAFNRVLDRRIDDGLLARLAVGDLAWKHDNGAVFAVTDRDLAGTEIERRLQALEISPSGPLWGAGMTRPAAGVAEIERQELEAMHLTPQWSTRIQGRLKGARRPLRVPVATATTEGGADEHGPYVRVSFELPGGCYATILLGEIMKT